ncbi:MAG: DUF1573 domain-containing protein [Phycisphaerae bacterium]
MRNGAWLLLLAVVGLAAFTFGLSWSRRPAPSSSRAAQVGFEPIELDLGKLPWHEKIPFRGTFRNGLSKPLIVRSVKPACGCTVIDASQYADKPFAPGASHTLDGTLDVGGALGQRRREIQLLDDTGAVHTLTVAYDAFATYRLQPDFVRFGEVDIDAPTAADSVQSIVFASDRVRLVGVPTSDSPWIDVALNERGNESDIVVRVRKSHLPPGRRFSQLTVHTDDPHKPDFVLPVQIEGHAACV